MFLEHRYNSLSFTNYRAYIYGSFHRLIRRLHLLFVTIGILLSRYETHETRNVRARLRNLFQSPVQWRPINPPIALTAPPLPCPAATRLPAYKTRNDLFRRKRRRRVPIPRRRATYKSKTRLIARLAFPRGSGVPTVAAFVKRRTKRSRNPLESSKLRINKRSSRRDGKKSAKERKWERTERKREKKSSSRSTRSSGEHCLLEGWARGR